jgi:predicted MPP superfamily phosphohydrolase
MTKSLFVAIDTFNSLMHHMVKPNMKKTALPLLLLGVLGLGIYGFFIEPAWIEVSYHRLPNGELSTTNFPWTRASEPASGWKPRFRVVQLSDLHLRQVGRIEERVVEKVNALNPDMLLLTGDLVDRPEGLPLLDNFLQKIAAKNKYAILGNWEYWGGVNLQELRSIYSRRGVTLLVNECVEYSNDGFIYQVAGLDDFTAGAPDERKIFEACKDDSRSHASTFFRYDEKMSRQLILMQHSPGYFAGREPLAKRMHLLTLSGHTHGGQISLFGIPIWTPPGSGPFVSGWYVTGYKDLYVSRGIGTSVAPFRFGSRPEIAVFDTK